MKRVLSRIGFAALLGAATLAKAEMTDLVDIPITIPGGTEPLVLEVHVGPVLEQTEIVIETLDGTYVGSISSFGFKGIIPAGFPQIAVERRPELTGDVRLTGKVLFKGLSRPATDDELRGIRVVSP